MAKSSRPGGIRGNAQRPQPDVNNSTLKRKNSSDCNQIAFIGLIDECQVEGSAYFVGK